jgi:hypothetical protein
MNAPKTAARIAALCASTAMTALLFFSQFGLAEHYTTEADAVVAAQRAKQVAHQAAETAVRQPNS